MYCVLQTFHCSYFKKWWVWIQQCIQYLDQRFHWQNREHREGKPLEKIYLEKPIITNDAIDWSWLCSAINILVNLMKIVVMRRPNKKLNCLNSDVRQAAIQTVLQLHADSDYKTIIDPDTIMYLMVYHQWWRSRYYLWKHPFRCFCSHWFVWSVRSSVCM